MSVENTIYIFFFWCVCVCVCLCSSKTCLLTLIFEFHSVFMFSWNLFLPHPSIKHCKNHLAGWIQPTGRNFPTPSLGWGSTVHITRVRESALALQQPGGCDSNGLVSAYLTRSVVNSDTPDFSLLLEIFTCPLGSWTCLFFLTSWLFLVSCIMWSPFLCQISQYLSGSMLSTLVLLLPVLLWSQPVSRFWELCIHMCGSVVSDSLWPHGL